MSLDGWTALTPANVPEDLEDLASLHYAELKDSGAASLSQQQSSITRLFICRWDERNRFTDDVLGYSTIFGVDPNYVVHRELPDRHPDTDLFYAMSCEHSPHGIASQSSGLLRYPLCKISVSYEAPPFAVKRDDEVTNELQRWVERVYGFQTDYLTIQGAVMKWVRPDRAALAVTPGITVGATELNVRWYRVPAKSSNPFIPPNINFINSCVGCVNSETFDGYPPGQVLFLGAEPELKLPALFFDRYYWQINFKFLLRTNGELTPGDFLNEVGGHNFKYDFSTGDWRLITGSGTVDGRRLYTQANLNNLFKIDAD